MTEQNQDRTTVIGEIENQVRARLRINDEAILNPIPWTIDVNAGSANRIRRVW